jgi:hypothetical protein
MATENKPSNVDSETFNTAYDNNDFTNIREVKKQTSTKKNSNEEIMYSNSDEEIMNPDEIKTKNEIITKFNEKNKIFRKIKNFFVYYLGFGTEYNTISLIQNDEKDNEKKKISSNTTNLNNVLWDLAKNRKKNKPQEKDKFILGLGGRKNTEGKFQKKYNSTKKKAFQKG